jgi:hypothetical protein
MRETDPVRTIERMPFNFFRYGGPLALLASVGCASHVQSPAQAILPQIAPPSVRHGAVPASAPAAAATVYISDFSTNSIDIYSNGGRELAGSITNGLDYAGALAVDPATSTLYASSLVSTEVYPGRDNRVRLYNGRVALPIAGYDWSSYQLPKANPLDIAQVAAETVIGNTLYVGANLLPKASGGTIGSALAQLPLFSKPDDALAPSQRAFNVPHYWCTYQMAGDERGNLYVAFVYLCGNTNPMRFQMREYAPGKSDGTLLPLPAAVSQTLGGFALDGKGDLVACDREHLTISVYPPGKTTAIRTISKGLKGCGGLVFGAGYHKLYVIDQPIVELTDGYPGVVDVFDYDAGRKEYVITKGLNPASAIPDGLAVDPPAQPGLPYH